MHCINSSFMSFRTYVRNLNIVLEIPHIGFGMTGYNRFAILSLLLICCISLATCCLKLWS